MKTLGQVYNSEMVGRMIVGWNSYAGYVDIELDGGERIELEIEYDGYDGAWISVTRKSLPDA